MRKYTVFLRILLSLSVLLALFLYIDFGDFWEVVAEVSPLVLMLAFFLNVLGSVLVNSLQFFIHVKRDMKAVGSFFLLWQIIQVDFVVRFYSLFMPVGATAIVRWHRFMLIGIGALSSGAAIVVNKLQQLFLIFLFVGVAFSFHETGMVSERIAFWISFFSFVLSGVLLLLLSGFFFGGYIKQLRWALSLLVGMRFLTARPTLTKRLHTYVTSYEEAIAQLSMVEFVNVVFWAFISFFVVAYSQSLIMQSLGVFLPFSDVLFLRGLVFLAMMVPFSVAGIGFREMGTIVGLSLYGVSTEIGLAVGVVLFGFQILISIIGGALEGWRFINR